MAKMNIFHYFPQDSLIHTFNTRFKFIVIFFFSLASLNTSFIGLVLLSVFMIASFVLSKLPFLLLLRDLKYFLFFIPIIILVPAFKIEGTSIDNPILSNLSIEGLEYGLSYAWKLILFLILGTLIIGTTTLSSITQTVEYFLTPIPFIPAAKIAFMIGLTINFLPLVFDQANEILSAQKSRGVEKQKNPIKRIRFLIYPLLVKTFKRVDEMAFAMEARCYTGNRTKKKVVINQQDWVMLLIAVLVCLVAVVI